MIDRGVGITGSQDLVRTAVAGGARRSLPVSILAGSSVDANLILVDGILVAAGTLLRNNLLRGLNFVRGTMTTGARPGA